MRLTHQAAPQTSYLQHSKATCCCVPSARVINSQGKMVGSSNTKPLPFPQMFASSAIAACTAEVRHRLYVQLQQGWWWG